MSMYLGVKDSTGKISREPSDDNGYPVKLTGSIVKQTQVGTDQSVAFANSDAANTQKSITITAPATPSKEHELIVYNPSTITDLTVKVFNVETSLASGSRDAYIASFSIPKSQAITGTTINTYAKFLHGAFNGGNLKMVISNDTVLGVADGFSPYVRLREV